ncbi:MAG TPA: sensor domain-containing diguanylate cyclase [Arenimonas sp.]|nr:sensor domain-containing diguanylate cyclase [Arenimonas sp.]
MLAAMGSDSPSAAEQARLAALQRTAIFGTAREPEFDLLTRLAAELCGLPYAFITFVDAESVWPKSMYGIEAPEAIPRGTDYCDLVVRSGAPLQIHDVRSDARTAQLPVTAEGLFRSYAGVPLMTADQQPIGTLCVLGDQPREADTHTLELLEALAGQVMALVELRQTKRELEANLRRMEQLASTDELTGLMNRRRLMQKLAEECARGRRSLEPLALVLLDLDHFKAVNDRWGHATGDIVLANTGRLILDSLRETDSAGRYGGEELCLILPGTAADGALNVAELLRNRMESLARALHGAPAYVTGSFGVALAISADDYHAEDLLARADAALYRAKHQGRNRVVLAAPEDA